VTIRKAQGWEDRSGGAYVLRDGQLILATEDVLGEVAHNAMLLSQGAERAIEMHREERAAAEGHVMGNMRP
jgi:hypothetical protein